MNVTIRQFVISVAALVILGSGCTNAGSEKFEFVDLSLAYSTTNQKSLKTPPDFERLDDLMSKVRGGASNVFLVRGKNIGEAVKNTRSFVVGWASVDKVEVSSNESLWLVVYFGAAGSSPPRWTLQSVERSKKSIRIHYGEGGGNTDDIRKYFAWIPIGDLQNGNIALELWNQKTFEMTLKRLVKVSLKAS